MAGATQTIVVNVPPEQFAQVISDYERYPEFLSEMEAVKVLERNGDAADVEFTLNLIKRIRYVLRLTTRGNTGLDWTLVEGMFKRNEGGWTLEPLGEGKTRPQYRVEVAVGVFVPGAIVNRLVGKTLPATLEAFKERAEKLHGSS